MDKFGRNYVLSIAPSGKEEPLIIRPPFTLEFAIDRSTMSSTSQCKLRIYNLNQEHRNNILKDKWTPMSRRTVILKAGYGPDISSFQTIYFGNINYCYSFREGNNFISEIECFDGGWAFASGRFNQNFPAGTPNDVVIKSMVASLGAYGVTPGAIGTYAGKIGKASSFSGNTMTLLRERTGGGVFIDNMKVNCLGNSETISTPVTYQVTSDSGLLATPMRQETFLDFEMVFEPNIKLGQQVQVNSQTGANYNGFYKVVRLYHRGIISDAVCGTATTSMSVFYGTEKLRKVNSTVVRV